MKYLLYGALLSCSASIVLGLMCHNCQTMERGTCNDPYPLNELNMGNVGECDNFNLCVKYTTVVTIRDSGYINGWERQSKVVTRTCEPKDGKTVGCTGWQNNGGVTIKCWCDTDGCNSGRSLSQSWLMLVLTLTLSTIVGLRSLLH